MIRGVKDQYLAGSNLQLLLLMLGALNYVSSSRCEYLSHLHVDTNEYMEVMCVDSGY